MMIASLALGFGGSVVLAGGNELDAIVGNGSPAQIEYTMPSDVCVLILAMTGLVKSQSQYFLMKRSERVNMSQGS